MSDFNKTYTVGEVAKATGITVRTLQHYDQIGLLSVSQYTEGKRRLYSEEDLLRLTQIIFYKSLGFSLKEIKNRLETPASAAELEQLFVRQYYVLLQKSEELHTAMSMVDACITVTRLGVTPPWAVLQELIRALPDNNVFEATTQSLDDGEASALSEVFPTFADAQSFHHRLKEIMVEAATLERCDIPPEAPAARELAARYNHLLDSLSGDESRLHLLAEVGGNRDILSEEYARMTERAAAYLQQAQQTEERHG